MRILLHSDHCYPADDGHGVGLATRHEPSGAPHRIHDLLARGLGELGHDVFYLVKGDPRLAMPPGVELTDSLREDVDIFHNYDRPGRPNVLTQHRMREVSSAPDHWIFVSRSLAELYGSRRFVRNGLDPEDFIYSETKDDYVLFLASMQGNCDRHKYQAKGLPVALSLAAELGFKLIVAGTARDIEIFQTVEEMCKQAGVTFVGDVRGRQKAEWIAGARALLFPTQMHEGLPLVVIEALFSGTPVIASHHGPCPEIVPPEVGFVCRSVEEYAAAIRDTGKIDARQCRDRAMLEHHYLGMTRGYLAEYEAELSRYGGGSECAGAYA